MAEKVQPGRTREVGLTEEAQFKAMENLQEIQRFSSLKPFNLNYFGSEQCESGYAFGPFVRTSYVMHLILSGRGVLRKQGTVYPVEQGQAFLIYPGEETTYQADEQEPWSYAWVGFHGIEAEDAMARAGFSEEHPVITCHNMEPVQAVMEHLLEFTELSYDNELIRTGCLYMLFGLLLQNHQEPEKPEKTGMESYYVNMAVNLLINSENGHVKVQDVAHTIGLSRGYLTTLFKKEMKMSPQEFVTRFRMEKASDLLTSTDNPVGLIASELGYHDMLAFSKSFRKYHGVSPTQYRMMKVKLVTKKKKGAFTSENPL